MKQTLAITRKELAGYFGSAMAIIFVATFLVATLVAFFRVDGFFGRGIADVRPLFARLPVLLIFLVAALTMRQWSEEQRSGTLEMLLTLPVKPWQLVLGKFLAVMALVALALGITLVLPITVSLMGNLDWGPVIGGYLAALLMAAAYTAIGLFVSSRTDNQIVALISTVLLCGVFYLVGARTVTDNVGARVAEILRGLGAGSRFESIERGVIDLRDLVYYLSLAGIFLVLNVWSLDRKRWSFGSGTRDYRRTANVVTLLLVANLALVNVWAFRLNGLRVDLTAQREYSLSPATRDLLVGLQEPLLIRGYFSDKTHPLLAPLVPTIRDMLREYEIAGRGKVTVDVLDPIKDPEKETEANQTYGINPTPLQVSGRNEASIINSYFDILVRYGDQNTVLNFRDLIEVVPNSDGTVDVHLRNLEYDLTRAIKRVTSGFQSVDSVLASMSKPAKLTLFATPKTLPQELQAAPDTIKKVAQDIQDKSKGKFTFEVIDPDVPGATVTRDMLQKQYRLTPIAASLFSSDTYYMDMVLQAGDRAQIVNPAGDLSETNIRTAIESGLKRASSGFLKVVGLWTPPANPQPNALGQMQQPLSSWQRLNQQLAQDYTVRPVTFEDGQVPSDVDVLVLVGPQNLTDKDRYAIDQYLMRGGSVVVAAGNYILGQPDQLTGSLTVQPVQNGLADMLASYGVNVEKSLVMDPQNEPFPVPVERKVGQFSVREIQAVSYPFFVDVRNDAMSKNSAIVSRVPSVTLNWASPVTVDQEKNKNRKVDVLLKSSAGSWLRNSADIQPNPQQYGQLGFPVEGERAARPLAVSIQGSFDSYFKGKPSPLSQPTQPQPNQPGQPPQPTPAPQAQTASTIEASPDTARLVVVGSAEFLDDIVFQISNSLAPERYLNSLQFMQNAVDWSVEDLDLLTIRSRGSYARVLAPLNEQQQAFWEGLNYILAALALGGLALAWTVRRRNERPMALQEPKPGAGAEQAASKA